MIPNATNNHYIKLLSLYLPTVSRIIIGLFTLQSIVWVAAMIAALVPAAGNPPNKCKTNTEHKYNNAKMKNAQIHHTNAKPAQGTNTTMHKWKMQKSTKQMQNLRTTQIYTCKTSTKARIICQKSQITAVAASLLLGSSSNAFGIVILLWHTANSSR